MAPGARLVLRPLAATALAAALTLALVAPGHALNPVPEKRPTAEQKRCAAAERRVARHREGLAQLDARLERDRSARASCTTARACERLDRGIRSEETRRRRIARQLAQFEQEAQAICAQAR